MAHVHVCRHGQDMDNVHGILNGHRDEPLSELGRSQAAAVAKKIQESGVSYTAIYSSPLQRAFATATAIGAAVGVPVQVRDDLIERDFGILSGKPYADITKYAGDNVLQGDKILYFLSSEGCETFDRCYERAQGVLADVDAKHPAEHVLLVCHGDIGKMLQAARAKVNWEDGLRLPYFANTEVIEL
ncbi:putative phosphoglycerate mutase protein [Leptomonas pyrrhocoris]|uniref:Putative phosphoglycerate mutase protein n=1 Tax=Leptomonas pyrrhocoris TaxID=157538 RepID=A0A0M9FRY8_LEPPY|nr:putative phosphoglycerate mutase protein [Leptomonas pyrrhocoris]KPA74803.1 putative phosphoglycerate mutase protein [Leptomonas pyrrhocoris]|eukprot:XP_015653242.1 putative phosphoglycerate mutase protein [Leptomonas pyrrhocoris]